MLFSSLTFLFVFLPIAILTYFLMPNRKLKNILLLIVSLLFYSWGEPKFVILMLVEITLSYFIALKLGVFIKNGNKKSARNLLFLECFIVLGCLFVFKYYDFFFVQVVHLNSVALNIALPIGISFYSFQILSYVFDVYKGEVEAQESYIDLALYVSLFPQLIAGPIVRYQTIAKELVFRRESFDDFAWGIRRFIIGLAKKIIIANHMAIVSDFVFLNSDIVSLSSFMCWLGAISFMLQIYFDFSGYSDMAIGLGRIFGFHFLENFNFPYMATSITDFWRRWHISLSSWFRDYVYIPLGGSRVNKLHWVMNIAIVWSLTGLWHGASYNFILWGIYFGGLLVLEKMFFGKYLKKMKYLNVLFVNVVVLFSWVLFNAPTLNAAVIIVIKMISGISGFSKSFLNNNNLLYLWPYYIIAIIGVIPWYKSIVSKIKNIKGVLVLYDVYLMILLLLCLMYLINNTYNPFIYSRF